MKKEESQGLNKNQQWVFLAAVIVVSVLMLYVAISLRISNRKYTEVIDIYKNLTGNSSKGFNYQVEMCRMWDRIKT